VSFGTWEIRKHGDGPSELPAGEVAERFARLKGWIFSVQRPKIQASRFA